MRKIFIIKLVCCLFFLLTGSGYANIYEGHVYTLLDANDWYNVENSAVAWGGHLVTINDSAENDWLVETFGGSETFWIGLFQEENAQEPDKGWKWISNDSSTFRNWASYEPNDYFSCEDVATINYHSSGTWNDENYSQNYKGIAEKAIPIPAAGWLLASGLIGVIGFNRKKFNHKN